jgi:tetratricopeptide (TPR) repeat protein
MSLRCERALAELVRREVLTISAEPLSPERGSYGFAQNMLRQVAYDTLSRRDRKTRHLTVAAHLRAAFPGDGEEVSDVIARHYLDALNAIPDDPDADEIRGQAVIALIRAAERAARTGAPARASTSYATAAGLIAPDTREGEHPADGRASAGVLWERAAHAAVTSGDWAATVEHAGRAREYHLARGQARAAARAHVIAGEALFRWGRLAEARERLTAAVEMLRAEPDTDTVRALEQLAALEVFAGAPDADRLSTEALTLGQALGIGASQLAWLLVTRGIYLGMDGRPAQAVAYFREAARQATEVGDNVCLGRALLNLSDVLAGTDPAAAAEAARDAAGHLRRTGARDYLAGAVINLVQALLMLGDWDTAESELTRAADADGLADHEFLAYSLGWLAALRGDTATAETMLAQLPDLRVSESPLDKALVSLVEAFTAAARGRPQEVLRLARSSLAYADELGISSEYMRWAWPLAARSAHDLQDTAATGELIALFDACQPGQLAPMQRAERDLVRARLAAADGDPVAATAFADAVGGLREMTTPYHLAHGLLDHAQFLMRLHDAQAAEAAIGEARDIARSLRCQSLLDRAADITSAKSPVQA